MRAGNFSGTISLLSSHPFSLAPPRMNDPATSKDNWRFRLARDPFTPELARKLRELCVLYGRCSA